MPHPLAIGACMAASDIRLRRACQTPLLHACRADAPPRASADARRQAPLEQLAEPGKAETEPDIDGAGEGVALGRVAQPLGIGRGDLDDAEQVEDADDDDERGVLD